MNSEEKNGLASNTEERQKIPIQSAGAPKEKAKIEETCERLLFFIVLWLCIMLFFGSIKFVFDILAIAGVL